MNLPLVTIAVVTYNSSNFIIETLESVKKQTYKNIELIISDDHSSDNTVDLCRIWLSENKDVFTRTALIQSKENTGVAKNSARALTETSGEWYKMLDGDDILFPNCIEDFVDYAILHPSENVISSYVKVYKDTFEYKNCIRDVHDYSTNFFELDSHNQLLTLAKGNSIYSVSVIVRTNTLKRIGGFDSRFIFEDYPLLINLLEAGEKIYFMPIVTAGYRIHDSVSRSTTTIFNYRYKKIMRDFYKIKCKKYLPLSLKIRNELIWGLQNIFEKLSINTKQYFNLYSVFEKFICKIFR